jgi:hypothetical protein
MRFFAAAELLSLIAGRPHTGTFDAESGEKRVRLFFREGKLEWAEGSAGSDAQALVTDLVNWSDGTFTFLDALALPAGVTPLDLDAKVLVAEAEQRVAEAQRLLQLYPDENTVFRVVPKPTGDVSLQPDEFQLLFQIGSGRSLAELRNETKRPPLELYPLIQKLQTIGLIEAVEGAVGGDPLKPKTFAKKRTSGVFPRKPAALIGTLTTVEGVMFPLLEDQVSVGRLVSNSISLPDHSISSHHARVLRSSSGFTLEDLGSSNGSFVNGDPVKEPRLLADGDVVRLGKVVLTFNLAAETKTSDTTQPEMGLPKS